MIQIRLVATVGTIVLADSGMSTPAFGKEGDNRKQTPNILFMAKDHVTQVIGARGSRLAKLNPTPKGATELSEARAAARRLLSGRA